MKIEITEKGVFDQKGERIEVGTELDIKGDKLPAAFVGKAKILRQKPAKAVAVTNPADGALPDGKKD